MVEDSDAPDGAGESAAPLEPAHTFSLLQPSERHPSPDAPPDERPQELAAPPAPPEPAADLPGTPRDDEPFAETHPDRPDPGPPER